MDVEVSTTVRDYNGIAGLMMSETERAVVATEGVQALLAFWTVREAIGKAYGTGLAGAFAVPGRPVIAARSSAIATAIGGNSMAVGHRDNNGTHIALAWLAPDGRHDALGKVSLALENSGHSGSSRLGMSPVSSNRSGPCCSAS
ncbi:MAG: 4-phosphopantetheinyl transferase family protein [Acetobacteraceae bacterium]|nr:4-phosphopantetheinyl transferase family protein [Acetobacteraceae bacterium]